MRPIDHHPCADDHRHSRAVRREKTTPLRTSRYHMQSGIRLTRRAFWERALPSSPRVELFCSLTWSYTAPSGPMNVSGSLERDAEFCTCDLQQTSAPCRAMFIGLAPALQKLNLVKLRRDASNCGSLYALLMSAELVPLSIVPRPLLDRGVRVHLDSNLCKIDGAAPGSSAMVLRRSQTTQLLHLGIVRRGVFSPRIQDRMVTSPDRTTIPEVRGSFLGPSKCILQRFGRPQVDICRKTISQKGLVARRGNRRDFVLRD